MTLIIGSLSNGLLIVLCISALVLGFGASFFVWQLALKNKSRKIVSEAEAEAEAEAEVVAEPVVEAEAPAPAAPVVAEPVAAEPVAVTPPVVDPAEIVEPPPQPKRGWWRRG